MSGGRRCRRRRIARFFFVQRVRDQHVPRALVAVAHAVKLSTEGVLRQAKAADAVQGLDEQRNGPLGGHVAQGHRPVGHGLDELLGQRGLQ